MAKEKMIGKYYVRMNEYMVITAGLKGGMPYYTYFPKTKAEADKIFRTLCSDVANW